MNIITVLQGRLLRVSKATMKYQTTNLAQIWMHQPDWKDFV